MPACRHGLYGSTRSSSVPRDEARRGHSVEGPALVKSALSAGRGRESGEADRHVSKA